MCIKNSPTQNSYQDISGMQDDIRKTKDGIGFRNAQISDLQQKIHDFDQENKEKAQWDTRCKMCTETFEPASGMKRDVSNKESQCDELMCTHQKVLCKLAQHDEQLEL